MKKILFTITTVILSLFLVSCGTKYEYVEGKINITTTTNIMADLAKEIGGDEVAVYSIMGAGVDPHTYKESYGDKVAMDKADYLLVSGLHLEGMMVEVIGSYERTKPVLRLGDTLLNKMKSENQELYNKFIEDADFGGNYDPHFWFDIQLYKEGAKILAVDLSEQYPEHEIYFNNNLQRYLTDLDNLMLYVEQELSVIDLKNRILVTAHDAFEYFANEFDFEAIELQGISTEDKVTIRRIEEVIDIIIQREVKAIFPETSIPRETIESIKDGVYGVDKSIKVTIGNDLYSDSIGDQEDDNTYIKMYKKNVATIVAGLAK